MSRRRLTPQETELWGRVAKGVRPFRSADPGATEAATDVLAPAPASRLAPSRGASAATPRNHIPEAKQRNERALNAGSAFGAGDPGRDRLAARRRLPVEAVLDLHGLTQAAALPMVRRFLTGAHRDGLRCVIVITGKGAGAGRRTDGPTDRPARGILRMRFQEWLDAPDLRPLIARVSQASQRDGGAGAFYVFLKARRADPDRIS